MKSRHIVLFDIDGTLLRGAGPHHKEALIQGAHSVLGLSCTLDGIDTSGRLDRDLLTLMLKNAGVAARRIAVNLNRIMSASEQHYASNCQSDLSQHLCPGVTAVLDRLRAAKIPLGLVTGNLSAIAWRKLELARISQYFGFGAFAEQGRTRATLARLAVRQARRQMLATKTCRVTLIGDHANDIAAAQANGFRSVAVASGVMHPDQLSRFKPDLLLLSLEGASVEAICGAI